jgi:hypothetical protein
LLDFESEVTMTEIRHREQPTGNVKEAVVEDKRG